MAPWVRARWRVVLRRAVGVTVAYALVLQATLALAIAHPMGPNAFDPLSVICVTDGGKAHAALPADPPVGGGEHQSCLDQHCALCAVAAPALSLLLAAVIGQLEPSRDELAPPSTDRSASDRAPPLPGRPRAPPALA